MTIQQIEYFLIVAEEKSFTKAVQREYVSQPAISKQITMLEKELGITLFDRRYRTATLTPPGKIVYETLERHRQEFKIACDEAKRRFSKWDNMLWIGLPGNSRLGNLHEILGKFQKEHPDLTMRVDIGARKDLAVRATGEDYDLILSPRLLSMERSRTNTVSIYHGRYIMLISRKHPSFQAKMDPTDLCGMPLYLSVPGSLAREVFARKSFIRKYGWDINDVMILPTVDSVIGAVRGLCGAGIVNDLVFVPSCYDLEVIPLDEPFELELAWRQENENPLLPVLRETILQNIILGPETC